MKVEMRIIIDDNDILCDWNDKEECQWAVDVLTDTKNLALRSNDIGDTIGKVILAEIINYEK